MFLFIPVLICVVSGDKKFDEFFREHGSNVLRDKNDSFIRCAVSCLTKAECLSYNVYTVNSVCEPLTKACGNVQEGVICYNRKISSRLRRTGISNELQQKDVKNKRERTYMLVLPNHLPEHSIRKMDVKSKAFTEYHGLSYVNIMSVTVMPVSRKLLLCLDNPYTISNFSLDTLNIESVRRAQAVALAVDEPANIIFFSLDAPDGHKKVLRMNTWGQDVDTLKRSQLMANSLATDPKNHKVYISYKVSIVAINYKTLTEETIVVDTHTKAITLDLEEGVLYYNQQWFLHSISLSDRKISKIINMWNEPESLEFYEDSIFIASWGRVNFLEVMHVNSRRTTIKFYETKETGKRPLMCKVNL